MIIINELKQGDFHLKYITNKTWEKIDIKLIELANILIDKGN